MYMAGNSKIESIVIELSYLILSSANLGRSEFFSCPRVMIANVQSSLRCVETVPYHI